MSTAPGSSAHEGLGPRGWLWLGLSLFGLNLALTFHNIWPTPWVTTRHELSAEVILLVLALCLWAERMGSPPRGVAAGLAGIVVLFALGRYAEVTAPALFGRRINLYWDGQHLPRVAAMFLDGAPRWLVVTIAAGAVAGLMAGYAVARLALAGLWQALEDTAARRGLAVGAVVLLAAYAAGHRGAGTLSWFSLPVSGTYLQQARFIHDALTGADVTADLAQPALPPAHLSRVAETDVVVLFLESYGAAAFDRPEYAGALEEGHAAVAAAASNAGVGVVSAFLESPTFGGASWLAHASLLSGIEIRDNASHAMLLTLSRDTLVHRFRQRGFRAVAVMPGLRQAWPEGSFYGFDRIYGEKALAYAGPAFGWWRIPDQFALARLSQHELTPGARKPVFAFFPTISTHAPFHPVPPYQADWQRMLGDTPFDAAPLEASLSRTPSWTRPGAAYPRALSYALRTLAGWLEQNRAPADQRDLVLVALGDHQPPAAVSGSGAGREVPVHVFTTRHDIQDALAEHGFEHGLSPSRRRLMPMHGVTSLLLEVFSGEPRPSKSFTAAPTRPPVDMLRAAPGPVLPTATEPGKSSQRSRDPRATAGAGA